MEFGVYLLSSPIPPSEL